MNAPSPQLDHADRELLVAYLDGELSSEDTAVVESRLASEAALRRELQSLQQAWDALGDLPRPAAAEDFTRTTLEMVAVAAREDVESATIALPSKRKRIVARLLAIVVIALVGGALLGRAIWPDRNQELLERLPVIENIDAYRHVGNIEFLEELHERLGERLARVSPLGAGDVRLEWQQWQTLSRGDEALRREHIETLDPAAEGKLHAKWRRYEASEKAQLIQLHQQLLEHDQSEALFATIARFGDLLNRHSTGDKAHLRSISEVDERLELVGQWVDRLPRDRLELTQAEKQLVIKWLQENSQSRRWDRRRRLTEEEEAAAEEALHQSLQTLITSLSPQVQRSLGELDDRGDRWRAIWRLREAVRPSWESMDEDLQAFFVSDQLDNDRRLQLLLMPEVEMRSELRREVYGPLFDDGPGRGRGGGRRGGGGPPGGRQDRGGPDDRDRDPEGPGRRGSRGRPGPPPPPEE